MVASLREGEWSCCRGHFNGEKLCQRVRVGQFNGERIVLLQRWPVMEENDC